MSNKCLYCCKPLQGKDYYHEKCSLQLFDRKVPPAIKFGLKDLVKLAEDVINKRLAIPGVQPKLSLDYVNSVENRLTIVGLWGRYVFKPPDKKYPEMIELEHTTMNMAAVCGILTARCGLLPLATGELSYITRRFDRKGDVKLRTEDMAQLTGSMTENKYHSSSEKIAAVVLQLCTNPVIELYNYFKLLLFCFITGSADMHLKKFSLLEDESGTISLAPAYDLLPTRLLIPGDEEELAIPVAGKKSNLNGNTFKKFGLSTGLNEKQISNIMEELIEYRPEMERLIQISFLSSHKKEAYVKLIRHRFKKLQI